MECQPRHPPATHPPQRPKVHNEQNASLTLHCPVIRTGTTTRGVTSEAPRKRSGKTSPDSPPSKTEPSSTPASTGSSPFETPRPKYGLKCRIQKHLLPNHPVLAHLHSVNASVAQSGRASPCQGECRGFESLHSLQLSRKKDRPKPPVFFISLLKLPSQEASSLSQEPPKSGDSSESATSADKDHRRDRSTANMEHRGGSPPRTRTARRSVPT